MNETPLEYFKLDMRAKVTPPQNEWDMQMLALLDSHDAFVNGCKDLNPEGYQDCVDSLRYVNFCIGGDPDEEYVDGEILEIRMSGAGIKQLQAALEKAKKGV